ncbi:TPA: hypothetical protein U1Z58_000379 [Streptococcus suis]|nr:hypothetical protein [Streptococcus suis]
MGKIKCEICGKSFVRKTSRSKYCSDKCRSDGNREKKRLQMKRLRAEAKKEKDDKSNRNIKLTKKRKKKKNLLKFYQDFKTKILANEAEFGFTSRTVIEGVEIHEPDFEEQVINKIKKQSK